MENGRGHMDFTQKYQLIELLPGEGVESYRARQTNTGRDVTVHLLVGGKNSATSHSWCDCAPCTPPRWRN